MSKLTKKLILLELAFSFIFSGMFATTASAQNTDELRDQLFNQVKETLLKARTENADLLSPNNFREANENYAKALEDFNKGKKLNEIRSRIGKTEELLRKALEVSKISKLALESVLNAREKALEAEAPKHALKDFSVAEGKFKDAAQKVEDGNINAARDKAAEAEKMYLESELSALRIGILGSAKNSVKVAEKGDAKDHALKTFQLANVALNEAENILSGDTKAAANARAKAEEAQYHAQHAILITNYIRDLNKKDGDFEDLILQFEDYISKIAEATGVEVRFDSDVKFEVDDIISAINSIKTDRKNLVDTLNEKETEIAELYQDLDAVRELEATRTGQLSALEEQLQHKKKEQEKFDRVYNLFSKSEADVLKDGNDIVIRLRGLNFPVGRAGIEPKYFNLLTKLQSALREYPNAIIAIEGHTDSVGNDGFNQRLSEKRAQAVRQYLIANMGLPGDRIYSVGYGESKPISSNDTTEGRMQNRRIDVAISPKSGG